MWICFFALSEIDNNGECMKNVTSFDTMLAATAYTASHLPPEMPSNWVIFTWFSNVSPFISANATPSATTFKDLWTKPDPTHTVFGFHSGQGQGTLFNSALMAKTKV